MTVEQKEMLLNSAAFFISLGCTIAKSRYNDKISIESETVNLFTVQQWVEQGSTYLLLSNIHKNNLIVIDLDNKEKDKGKDGETEFFKQLSDNNLFLTPDNLTGIVNTYSGKGKHIYFKCETNLNRIIGLFPCVDIISSGLVAMPGCIRDGKQYLFNETSFSIPDIPKDILEFLIKSKGKMDRTKKSDNHDDHPLGRNNRLFDYGISINDKYDEEQFENFHEELQRQNLKYASLYGEEPLDDIEVKNTAVSAFKYDVYEFNDLGDSKFIKSKLYSKWLWAETHKSWYYFDGIKWNKDNDLTFERLVFNLFDKRYLEAENKKKEKIKKHVMSIMKKSGQIRGAIISTMKPFLAVNPAIFDKNKYLLNFRNGTLDLKTFKFRKHNINDFITQLCDFEYDPSAKPSDIWYKFIFKIFQGNPDLIEYVQKIMGHSLTGETKFHRFFIFFGRGANGKSTLINIFKSLTACSEEEIIKNYTHCDSADKIMDNKFQNNESLISQWKRTRALFCEESKESSVLDTAKMKQLTGENLVTARQLYERAESFMPMFKVFLITNNKPVIKDPTIGSWRRIELIPFKVSISNEEKIEGIDKLILAEGKAGLMNWFLEGLKKIYADGDKLNTPKIIQIETDIYKAEEDELDEFLMDCCEKDENSMTQSSKLYAAYLKWATGRKIMSSQSFSPKILSHGYEKKRTTQGFQFLGIKLKEIKTENNPFNEETKY